MGRFPRIYLVGPDHWASRLGLIFYASAFRAVEEVNAFETTGLALFNYFGVGSMPSFACLWRCGSDAEVYC